MSFGFLKVFVKPYNRTGTAHYLAASCLQILKILYKETVFADKT
jgi:hypothetical protein